MNSSTPHSNHLWIFVRPSTKLLFVTLSIFGYGCAQSQTYRTVDPIRPEVQTRVANVTALEPTTVEPHENTQIGSILDEDALVAMALENNSAFKATVDRLGIARGDWIQAGLLTNPNLANMFPVGVKQWEWTLYIPIESFLLRPHREAIAHSDYHRVAGELVQNGLILVRDVRVAYTDYALAVAQFQLAEEALQIREEIRELTKSRLDAGDIGELEARQAKIDAITATANLAILKQNVEVTRNRIHTLIGMPYNTQAISADLAVPSIPSDLAESDLVSRGLESRPDMRAAHWAIDASSKRRRFSRWMFWKIDGVVDANQKGQKGYEVGPGLRFDIPIFNRNEGGVLRANAELCQAFHNRDAIHDQIIEEVRSAAIQIEQTREGLAILSVDVVPALAEAIQIAKKGYEDGGTGYLFVLQSTTQYLDARVRELEQIAALRRAHAELERSIAGPLFTESPQTHADPQLNSASRLNDDGLVSPEKLGIDPEETTDVIETTT